MNKSVQLFFFFRKRTLKKWGLKLSSLPVLASLMLTARNSGISDVNWSSPILRLVSALSQQETSFGVSMMPSGMPPRSIRCGEQSLVKSQVLKKFDEIFGKIKKTPSYTWCKRLLTLSSVDWKYFRASKSLKKHDIGLMNVIQPN